MNKHLYWIDLAKVIGLYFMILGHGNMVSDEFRCYIYSFHMPLFFIISGLLTKDNKGGVNKNYNNLIIPYICLNVICLIFFTLIEFYKGIFSLKLLMSHFFAIVLGVGYETDSFKPVCTPMWFFYVLFLIKIMYHVVPSTKVFKAMQFILCFILVKWLTYYNIDTLLPIDSAIMAYPFFLIGTELKRLLDCFGHTNRYMLLFAFIALIMCYFVSLFNGRCDIDTMRYGSFYSLFIFTGTVIAISILVISRKVIENFPYRRFYLQTFCAGAPLIVGLNLLVINVIKPFLSSIVGEWNDIYGITLGLIIMCFFYPLILFTRRYMPIILGNR